MVDIGTATWFTSDMTTRHHNQGAKNMNATEILHKISAIEAAAYGRGHAPNLGQQQRIDTLKATLVTCDHEGCSNTFFAVAERQSPGLCLEHAEDAERSSITAAIHGECRCAMPMPADDNECQRCFKTVTALSWVAR